MRFSSDHLLWCAEVVSSLGPPRLLRGDLAARTHIYFVPQIPSNYEKEEED